METEHYKITETSAEIQSPMENPENKQKLFQDFTEEAVYEIISSEKEEVIVVNPVPKCIILTKAELQCYISNPYWKSLRWFLLIIIGVAWTSMLTMAIIIPAMGPKCSPKPSIKWWQNTVCYQIWTKSFQDSDNDGVGDIPGITKRVKQLAWMNIQTIWPLPLLRSTSRNGYDIVNFYEVDPELGTMDDLQALIDETHKYSMKFVMDIPLLGVSMEHEWFNKSAHGDPVYNKYFIPSSESDKYDQYRLTYKFRYSSPFPHYANFNWTNFDVRISIKDVLKFWLDKGVDGFYFDNPDERSYIPGDYRMAEPIRKSFNYYFERIVNFTRTSTIRELLLFSPSFFMGDPESTIEIMGRFDFVLKYHVAFDYCYFADRDKCPNAEEIIYTNLARFADYYSNNKIKTWPMSELGNPYRNRMASRSGSREKGELMNMLLLILPGPINTYYGDEIGMKDTYAYEEITKDEEDIQSVPRFLVFGGDPRSAMQWNTERNAGFSLMDSSLLKIAVNPDFNEINLESQLQSKFSTARMYRRLAGLRNTEEALLYGSIVLGPKSDKFRNLFSLFRNSVTGTADILCILNFGDIEGPFDLSHYFEDITFGDKYVSTVITSSNLGKRNVYGERSPVDISRLDLKPNEGIVLKLKSKKINI